MLTYAQLQARLHPAPAAAPPGPAPAAHGGASVPRPGAPASAPEALSRYRQLDLEAKVAAASPHGLVLMLFERLQQLLREAELALERGDRVARCRAFEKALAIVDGLETTLDSERGGEVAATLRRTYGLLRDRIVSGRRETLAEAREIADALADAWRRIGPDAGR